ncbi:error-prone DNA polymerase [Ancylobacter sp. Lp-2]|uniref:error-prone DNA polymerase n=1 Tax=Ancylobacter sp. Lp-2 TaxID=2881339 RepID=UPI001E400630|nr:error-prone DNA polymerase [Ancylobacter sp. Lp-2]MCB4768442.1 error-prone DNA polymerase [Ancylobacter sp. Lp-2]
MSGHDDATIPPEEAASETRPVPFYAELAVTSNFSFLRGASTAADLVTQALALGHAGIGIADRNTVAGVVRAYAAVQEANEAWKTNWQAERARPATEAEKAGNANDAPIRRQDGQAAGRLTLVAAPGDANEHDAESPGGEETGSPDPRPRPLHQTHGTPGREGEDRKPEKLSPTSCIPSDGDGTEAGSVDIGTASKEADAIDPSPAPSLGSTADDTDRETTRSGSPADADAASDAPPPLPFKLVVGARLAFADGTPDILAYPQTRTGWGRLCRLLTAGNLRAGIKGECHLHLDDLLADAGGLSLILMPPRQIDGLDDLLARLHDAAPGSLWLAADMPRRGDDRRRLAGLKACAARAGVPLLAVNDVLYHHPDQRDLQDVLTCIRQGTTIATAGRLLEANAERHLKSPDEMARLFREAPEALAETRDFLDRIDFSLDELKYEYPEEPVPPGYTPQDWLEELTWRRAALRYPAGVPGKVEAQLKTELSLIAELGYAPYFLTIRDIVDFAERNRILCQGRGSAANSAVCYVLGITAVDPSTSNLLFSRFIARERREPPDIDVDFEHERREEVMQYVYRRYGRDRAGIVATVISYRPRSAFRDVGKALGLTEDVTARLAGTVWGSWGEVETRRAREAGLDPDNPTIARVIGLARRLIGFPRHLSQHVGGFVLSQKRLDEIVPIGPAVMANRTFIEWDKDDIDTLKLMKVDVLALGMLTCIRKALDLIRAHEGLDYGLADVPLEQTDIYDMLCRGDSIGVFQVESRAQINMLPRLKPRKLYDLVIQVAIVRPGPIQGNMVHPYLRRREGVEPVSYPSPAPPHDPDELKEVLSRTLGVPLFQEQAMQLAMVAARFTDVEANQLRRAMATFRNLGTIGRFRDKLIGGMTARGYQRAFAERCFQQIQGFGEYGFPESHAASFAKLVYISAYIKCRHPAVFACALLNSQPMGFYAPAQIVRDAREHGVEIRPVDVNRSAHDCTLEERADGTLALRLGFRQVDGIGEAAGAQLVEARGAGYPDIEVLARRTRLPTALLTRLAEADAFGSMGLSRREAAWAVRRLPDDAPLPLFAAADARELGEEHDAPLPLMPLPEAIAIDYQTTRLSLKGHPMGVLRPVFAAERVLSSAEVAASRDGAFLRTAGIVLVRQRPGKGNAIFMTLEDETGIVNVLIWARLFERYRAQVMGARLVMVEGRVQKSKEGVVHLMGERIHDRTAELSRLFDGPPRLTPPNVDPGVDDRANHRPGHMLQGRRSTQGHPRQVRLLPKSRDFH